MAQALKCVTQWVRICVDMFGTPSDNYQCNTRDAALIPTHNHEVLYHENHLYYLSEHVVLLIDTLHCPR